MRTVRAATFDVLRQFGLTTIFANPGSTEITFLTDLPDDLRFVLALHEGSVVGMATGWATANDRPALVNLHTTAGLGNAVGALATARSNRVPLVVIVGQQDRGHLAFQPFLAGTLTGLAGSYPVWADQPVRAQDVPGAVARAWHEAVDGRGPALVIVPSDDWGQPAADTEVAAPAVIRHGRNADPSAIAELAELVAGASSPALVVGADADHPDAWAALVELAERLECPVWQEAFAARAGFPQDHRLYAGILPAGRGRLREALADNDFLLVVGAPVFRQYPYEPGLLVNAGTVIAMVTNDVEDAHHSPVQLCVVADPAQACRALVQQVEQRPQIDAAADAVAPVRLGAPAADESLRAGHVMSALAERITRDTVIVEETPSSRPELHRLLPARSPLGFLSAAMGGLGFALPAAIGVRMATPDRAVIAVVGDGSSLYGIQSLWSAAQYNCGVLFVVLANGRYAVMDRLAERQGGKAPWPAFETVSIHQIALGLGCAARRVDTYDDLIHTLDEVIPTLAVRTEPLVLEVTVEPDVVFEP